MAKLKVFPKGSTEAIEWTINSAADAEDVAGKIANSIGTILTVPLDTGWVRVDPAAYGALEVIQ
ncbi:hypothetical protein ABQE45_03430 [Mycobacteroides chelonae]